jgi:hypothetical protein
MENYSPMNTQYLTWVLPGVYFFYIHKFLFQYDIDNDGMLDVLIFTSDGEILPYKLDGTLISKKVFKVRY